MEENLTQEQSAIIKIAMFGPESTGKTTLAIQLAEYYKTVWVPEFARDYLQEKWDDKQVVSDVDDMLPIAYGQTKFENYGQSIADKYLFCDTNLMVTKVFSEVNYGYCDPLLAKAAQEHEYDLFFLTDIDVPWEKDDLRDKPEGRKSIFEVFKKSLIDNNKPFITLSGDKALRLEKAIAIIDDLTRAKEMGLSSLDFVQIYEHGVPIENIQNQLEIFEKGISKTELIEPATLFNGILKLSEKEAIEKAAFFDDNKGNYKLLKFVPASGAASRMFKFLITFLKEFSVTNESIKAYVNRKKNNKLPIFVVGLEKLPFYEEIDRKLREEILSFDSLHRNLKLYYFIKLLLSEDYFDYANKPKGVLPFHKYKTHTATAIEEHLYECSRYSSSNGVSNLHFTVSEEHLSQFEAIINTVKPLVEEQAKISINVNYSFQKKSTDTIAVNVNNSVFRTEENKLVFRPGGHGALIENLNNLDADIVFVKNIDNVSQNDVDKVTFYKKVLTGVLIEQQQKVFYYLERIDGDTIDEGLLNEIVDFLKEKLNIILPFDYNNLNFENKVQRIATLLDRPIRVCGMVINEGEPGGGPFWTKNGDGVVSLQIVESSEVDLLNNTQKNILTGSTHFNPVDLVCGIKNYKNEKFDLTQFIDHDRGFIVGKSISGKDIKAYELPGLWNGAMANWLTVFVQVPLVTFNPVKTVNDLLNGAHQPK
jgi:nicotinamide riboside kinase